MQSYDKHMKKILPQPKLIPIRVNVVIESKNNMRVENIYLKPYDNINDLFKQLEDSQQLRGDSVLNWNKEKLQFVVTGPLRIDNANL